MSVLKRLFKKSTSIKIPSEIQTLKSFEKYIQEIEDIDHYISRKEYLSKINDYKNDIDALLVLKDKNILNEYAKKYKIDINYIMSLINIYYKFPKYIDEINQNYLNKKKIIEKDYLDNILKKVDKNIVLDDEQREVVLSDEDYTLVIAGAGAGKTTTVAAKVKYLVEKQNINAKDILIISFTNKAVGELQEKINKYLKIDSPITTFHATGNAILRKQSNEPLHVATEGIMHNIIQTYFTTTILKNESSVKKLLLFFASYFDAPYDGEDLQSFFKITNNQNHVTLKSDLEEYKKEILDRRTKKKCTIRNEQLRSIEEVSIANFLYLNNIDYEYEPLYPYNLGGIKPYTPDFLIKQDNRVCYLEHFGITESGENNLYNSEELSRYKQIINHKILFHKQHNTNLIYTFSKYKDQRTLLEHLEENLINKGFILGTRNEKDTLEKLISTEENKYITKLVHLMSNFLSNFKVNGYNEEDFDRLYHKTKNVRNKLFLNIARECYITYQKYLKENNLIDFQDMINNSAKVLKEVKDMKQKLSFKYIIVDEYQDISKQRFDLVKALSEVCDAKIMAVGDDWQSIYAFSGSDITLFTEFKKKMGYAKVIKIENTYRNAQELIDIAGNFIQKNSEQIKKTLKSNKKIKYPIIIYTYDSSKKLKEASNNEGANYNLAKTVENILTDIININKKEGKNYSNILLLGRYAFDSYNLERTGLFEIQNHTRVISIKYPYLDITFMTVHSSKGLGYDNVIILNGKNETYGFPTKIEDDPVLNFVIKQHNVIEYAEERRLFYVALTRTKNRIFIAAPKFNPSEFLLEIKNDYSNVTLKGLWEENAINIAKKTCPKCGYPLQYRYKEAIGLPLFICTNEPEICDFMTNNYEVKEEIRKCPDCIDGYLIVKKTKDDNYILGCTNYKKNKEGCNKIIHIGSVDEKIDLPKDIMRKPQRKTDNKSKEKPKRIIIDKLNLKQIYFNNYDLNEIIFIILQTLSDLNLEYFYQIHELVDILKGSENETIKKRNLKQLEGYASLKNLNKEYINLIIHYLIENHYIIISKGKLSVLHLTNEGYNYKDYLTIHNIKKLKSLLEDYEKELLLVSEKYPSN